MRKIKFRAYRHKDNSMVHFPDKDLILECGDFGQNWLIDSDNWKLMQYTGLKDKNGKEIYEGDIVKNTWNAGFGYETDLVETEFEVDYRFGCFFPVGGSGGEIEMSEYEIIGNIYENHELLK